MPSQVDMYDKVPTVPEAKPRVSFDLRDVEALQKSADETAPEWALEIVSSKSRFIIDFGCEGGDSNRHRLPPQRERTCPPRAASNPSVTRDVPLV